MRVLMGSQARIERSSRRWSEYRHAAPAQRFVLGEHNGHAGDRRWSDSVWSCAEEEEVEEVQERVRFA